MAIWNSATSYGSVSTFLHWLIFLLVSCLLVVGFVMVDMQDKVAQANVFNAHKLTGLTVLVLMIIRASWALLNPKPELPKDIPNWQQTSERVLHFLLYVILIAMPIVGWVTAVSAGYAPHIGSIKIGLPIAQNKFVANLFGTLHGLLAFVIITFVSIHVAAALYHYFVKKDKILQRML